MKTIQTINDVTKVETFANDRLIKVYNSKGLFTLIHSSDGSLLFDDKTWFKEYKKYKNMDDFIFFKLTREDGLFTLITQYGSFICDKSFWFKNIEEFGSYYKITRNDNLFNLIYCDRHKYVLAYEDFWFKYEKMIEWPIYKLIRQDGLFTLFSLKNNHYCYDNFKNILLKDCNTFDYDNNLYKIIRRDGLSTLIYKSNGSFVYNNLWFKDWIDFNSKYYRVIRKDGLSTLIYKYISSFVYDNLWFKDWIDFDHSHYKIVRENGLSTLIYKADGSFVYNNLWFKDWKIFSYDNYEVIREDGLSTLINNKKDGSYPFDNIWVKSWQNFNNNYYKVINENNLSNLINKNDGSWLIDVWIPENDISILPYNYFSIIKHGSFYMYKDE